MVSLSVTRLETCPVHGALSTAEALDLSDRRKVERYGVCRRCKRRTESAEALALHIPPAMVQLATQRISRQWPAEAGGIVRRFAQQSRSLVLLPLPQRDPEGLRLFDGDEAAFLRDLPVHHALATILMPWTISPSDHPSIRSWSGCVRSVIEHLLPIECINLALEREECLVKQVVLSGSLLLPDGGKLPQIAPGEACATHGADALRAALLCRWDYRSGGSWDPALLGETAALLSQIAAMLARNVESASEPAPASHILEELYGAALQFDLHGSHLLLSAALVACIAAPSIAAVATLAQAYRLFVPQPTKALFPAGVTHVWQ